MREKLDTHIPYLIERCIEEHLEEWSNSEVGSRYTIEIPVSHGTYVRWVVHREEGIFIYRWCSDTRRMCKVNVTQTL